MAERHMEWGNDGWNGRMMDGMAKWQNGIMAEWHNGRMAGMAEWLNGGMARLVEWRNGGMAYGMGECRMEWLSCSY